MPQVRGPRERVHVRGVEVSILRPGTAIDALLAGLIDYAGLYPPASLDMRSAVENYRRYRSGTHAYALGRFIVDAARVDGLRAVAGNIDDLKLSVIVSHPAQTHNVSKLIDEGAPIEAVEAKAASPADVEQITRSLPLGVHAFIETPGEPQSHLLRAISNCGACAKLRMGGVGSEAFPSIAAVARTLESLIRAGLAFKATAGLHHPIRSRHPFTYAQDSPLGMMHGFINLIGGTTLLHFGASAADAQRVLDEQNPKAWNVTPQSLEWRSYRWTTDQLSGIRQKFVSFGSCSFEEPIRDLEALGWL